MILCISALFTGCSQHKQSINGSEKQTILILAAASLTNVLADMKAEYEAAHENVELVFSFDSSGTLRKQIEEGVDADIFLSASPLPVMQLIEGGYVSKDQVIDLLTNEIVLISNNSIEVPIQSFEKIVTDEGVDMIATCMEEVPIGQYTIQLYKNLGLAEELEKKANYASNVRQILDWVESGNVPYGIVYSSDAAMEEAVTVQTIADSSLYPPVQYQAAIVSASDKQDAANDFLQYLKSDTAKQLFSDYGFETVQ